MEKYFNWKETIVESELEEMAKSLRSGKIAIFPTETVYGIGTNGLDSEAVKKTI